MANEVSQEIGYDADSEDESQIIEVSSDQVLQEEKRDPLYKHLVEICPDIEKIFNGLGDISSVDSKTSSSSKKKISNYRCYLNYLKDEKISVKGHIQSGKTNFMIASSIMCIHAGFQAVIILRNSNADREQIFQRINMMLETIKKFDKHITVSKVPRARKRQANLQVALSNVSSLKKVLECVKRKKYVLFIDEVDHVDYSKTASKTEELSKLKDGAHCVFGVSATIMDFMANEEVKSKYSIVLTPPKNYKGFQKIKPEFIDTESYFSGKVSDDLLENDPSLLDYIEKFSKEEPYNEHPRICLINICDTIEPYKKLQKKICKKFPMVTSIVYSAREILVMKGKKKLFEDFVRSTISQILQSLKEDPLHHQHIIILAGDLASRGISFVSKDYQWHLTCMRLLVADKCSEPNLLQKLRLLGIFNDNIDLVLSTTPSIWEDCQKAFFKQEEVLTELKKQSEKTNSEFFEEFSMNSEKFTQRNICNNSSIPFYLTDEDQGWPMDVYSQRELPEDVWYNLQGLDTPDEKEREQYKIEHFVEEKEEKLDELEDLKKKFKNWSTKKVAIANFLYELEPEKMYTKNQMMKLCTMTRCDFSHVQNSTYGGGSSKGYGKIIQKIGERFRLYPELVETHKKFF